MEKKLIEEARSLYGAGRKDEAEALISDNVDEDVKDIELYFFYSQFDDYTKTMAMI